MFYLAGIFINFFLMAMLIGKKNKHEADWILALWLFFMGVHLSFYYFSVTKQFFLIPLLMGMEIPFPLIHGPFLYLYTSALTYQASDRKFRFLHFLPFALAYIPLLPFIFSPAESKLYVYSHKGQGYEWYLLTLNLSFIVSGIAYVLLSLRKLNRHRKNISDQFSNTEKINLIWLRNLIFGLGVIWLIVIFGKDELTFTAVVIYILFIGYYGIMQTDIFSHNPSALPVDPSIAKPVENEWENTAYLETTPEVNPEKGKYLKSGLDENEMHQIHNQLTDLMQQERVYTNPELTLGEIAQMLNIHPNHLSQVINSIEKKNFYDYINSRRVEEFNKVVRMPKNQKFTLLSLAYECGFNSKTSFNRNFRKVTGLSPSEYLKQIQVSLSPEL